jgi:hypothetical protein
MLAERAGAASAQATPTKEHAATLLGVKRRSEVWRASGPCCVTSAADHSQALLRQYGQHRLPH